MKALEYLWYRHNPWHWLLWPLTLPYRAVVWLRWKGYKRGLLRVQRLPVPVIVVGNITVGGTGKTPLVIWLVEQLRRQGFSPGVVSRGYGGRTQGGPLRVGADSDPAVAGDEPVLLARRLGCPLMVHRRRSLAAQRLIDECGVDVVVADDGLQHYALGRDLEIAVVDGDRGTGNGQVLPAGPLREPASRLNRVDLIVVNGGSQRGGYRMQLQPGDAWRLDGGGSRPLAAFAGQRVHAVAGIGHPQRFFRMLRELGLDPLEHGFADHHAFTAQDIDFSDNIPVLMTEKDAVKCRAFARPQHWVVPVEAQLDLAAQHWLGERMVKLRGKR